MDLTFCEACSRQEPHDSLRPDRHPAGRPFPISEKSMSKQHTYVLGLNTYDHDVSACLLKDGAIAFAVAKERITREKHASGFYKEVIDYCLDAEGITLDDIDLV